MGGGGGGQFPQGVKVLGIVGDCPGGEQNGGVEILGGRYPKRVIVKGVNGMGVNVLGVKLRGVKSGG